MRIAVIRKAIKELGGEEFCKDCVNNFNSCLRIDSVIDPNIVYSTKEDRWLYLVQKNKVSYVIPYENPYVAYPNSIEFQFDTENFPHPARYSLNPKTGNWSRHNLLGIEIHTKMDQNLFEALKNSVYRSYPDLPGLSMGEGNAWWVAYVMTHPGSTRADPNNN